MFFLPAFVPTFLQVRGKKTAASGSTKNECGHPKGKKRGMKVFDGQRVPKYSILHTQLAMDIMPGWNVEFSGMCNLTSSIHGRVMLTMERCDPRYGTFEESVRHKDFKDDSADSRALFKPHLHIIPDEQHQYFKLVEQV